MSYIHMPTEQALRAKWKRGEDQYGGIFVGHPLEELDEELLDAMNYTAEAERQGWDMCGLARTLGMIRESVRRLYQQTPARPNKEAKCLPK